MIGPRTSPDEDHALYDAYRLGDDAVTLQRVADDIARRAYEEGRRALVESVLVEDEDGAPYPPEVQEHFREAYADAAERTTA